MVHDETGLLGIAGGAADNQGGGADARLLQALRPSHAGAGKNMRRGSRASS